MEDVPEGNQLCALSLLLDHFIRVGADLDIRTSALRPHSSTYRQEFCCRGPGLASAYSA